MDVPAAPHLDRLLGSLLRRQAALRAAERAGVAVAVASAAVVLLVVPAALWTGAPVVGAAAVALPLAAATGAAWGALRRPNLLQIAAEADGQLGLDELLATAVALRGRGRTTPGDTWLDCVVAAADARCRALDPASVALRRFGPRSWGGTLLAALFALSFAAAAASWSPTPAPARGEETARVALASDNPATSPESAGPLIRFPAAGRPTAADVDPQADEPDRLARSEDQRQPAEGHQGAAEKGGSPGGQRQASDHSGRGHGSGRTAAPAQALLDPLANGTGAPQPTARSGAVGGGGGPSASRVDGDDVDFPSGLAGSRTAPSAVPPWQSPAWPADVRRAAAQLQSGSIPSAYRDLVRAYFAHEGE